MTLALPLMAGAATLITGSLVQRIHSDLLLRWAIVANLTALALIGFADSFALLIPAWIVMGIAFGMVDATMNMRLSRWAKRSVVVTSARSTAQRRIVASLAGVACTAQATTFPSRCLRRGVHCPRAAPHLDRQAPRTRARRSGRHRCGHRSGCGRARSRTRAGPLAPVLSIGVVLTSAYFIESSASSWGSVYVHDTLAAPESISRHSRTADTALRCSSAG